MPELSPASWPIFPSAQSASWQPVAMRPPPPPPPPVTPAAGMKGDTVLLLWNLHQKTYRCTASIRAALKEIDFDVKTVQRVGDGGAFIVTIEEEWHAKCLTVALNGSRHLDSRSFVQPLRVVAFGLWGEWMGAVDEDMPEWPVELQVAYSASVRKSHAEWDSAVQKL